MSIDRKDVLILTDEVTQCANCKCDCHSESELHRPSDELYKGGACGCDECQSKKA